MGETWTIKNIEQKYLSHKRNDIYIMLEDEEINWYWDDAEVLEFDQMFNEGAQISELAAHFGRPTFEVALLIMDRDLKGMLGAGKHAN